MVEGLAELLADIDLSLILKTHNIKPLVISNTPNTPLYRYCESWIPYPIIRGIRLCAAPCSSSPTEKKVYSSSSRAEEGTSSVVFVVEGG